MALLVRILMAACLAVLAFGQRPAGLPGAFGRGFMPGSGGLPARPPGGAKPPGFPPPLREHRGAGGSQAPSVVVVPFPVYGSGDAGPLESGGPDQAQPAGGGPPVEAPLPFPEDPSPPPIGIPRLGGPSPDENPSACLSSAPPEPPRPPAEEAQPIIYLIALKNHIIVQAFGYWIENGALHYVSAAYGLNQVSLSLVDQDFSRRLNEERGVKFDLGLGK